MVDSLIDPVKRLARPRVLGHLLIQLFDAIVVQIMFWRTRCLPALKATPDSRPLSERLYNRSCHPENPMPLAPGALAETWLPTDLQSVGGWQGVVARQFDVASLHPCDDPL